MSIVQTYVPDRLEARRPPRALGESWNRTVPLGFSRGEYVYLPGDPARSVFLVRSGAVRLARLLDAGGELTLDVVGPGEFFGEGAVLGEAKRRALAVATEPVRISPLPASALRLVLDRDPALSLELARSVADRAARLEARATLFAFGDCRQRVAALLLEMVDRYGRPEPGGLAIGIRVTHEEIAKFVGAARETITPLLVTLRREGAIDYDRRRILVRDEAALERVKNGPRARSAGLRR